MSAHRVIPPSGSNDAWADPLGDASRAAWHEHRVVSVPALKRAGKWPGRGHLARQIPFATLPFATLLGLAVVAGGCSGGGLTTGALLPAGNNQASQVAAPPAPLVTSTDRALQVATTSARAVKCGFYFDAAKLRSAFLAAEAKAGATPEQMQKTEREYEAARASMITKISKDPDYCSDERTREIKADLNRHLAGDFSPSRKVQATAGGGWLDILDAGTPAGREELNPEWIRDPRLNPNKTRRIEQ